MRTSSHWSRLLPHIDFLELDALIPFGLRSIEAQYGSSLMVSVRSNSLCLQSLTHTHVKVGLSLVPHLVLKCQSLEITSRVSEPHPRVYALSHSLNLHVQHMLLFFLIKELVSADGWLLDGTVLLFD